MCGRELICGREMFRAGPVRIQRLRRFFSASASNGGPTNPADTVVAAAEKPGTGVAQPAHKNGNGASRAKYALLYASKTPIFPLQTFISSIRENDKTNLQRLSIKDVAACYLKTPEDETFVTQEIKDLIAESHNELKQLIEAEEAYDGLDWIDGSPKRRPRERRERVSVTDSSSLTPRKNMSKGKDWLSLSMRTSRSSITTVGLFSSQEIKWRMGLLSTLFSIWMKLTESEPCRSLLSQPKTTMRGRRGTSSLLRDQRESS